MAEKTQEDRDHEWSIELFKSVIESGKAALNTLLLVCGGSALALLAFIGNLAAKDGDSPRIAALAPALLCYASSLGVIAFEAGATYIAQFFFAGDAYRAGVSNTWHRKVGNAFNLVAAAAFAVALCLYAWGSIIAYRNLSSLNEVKAITKVDNHLPLLGRPAESGTPSPVAAVPSKSAEKVRR